MRVYYFIIPALLCLLFSCHKLPVQTVESGYFLLDENDPKYKFSRNQESSVLIDEPRLLKQVLKDLDQRFFDKAYLRDSEAMNQVLKLYKDRENLYKYAPYEYVAGSLTGDKREELRAVLEQYIQDIAKLSGYGLKDYDHNSIAAQGQAGRISNGLSTELIYVDERGLQLSQIFQYSCMAFIALDRIFNIEFKKISEDKELFKDNDNNNLIDNANYTALEHHWDLAYGYYKYFFRELANGDGIPALRGLLRELDLAFVLARIDIKYHKYDKLPEYMEDIRKNVTKVLLIRLRENMLGGNTLTNLSEDKAFAFPYLSRAYALISAFAFVPNGNKSFYLSYEQVREFQNRMLKAEAFWAVEASSLEALYKDIDDKLK